ncbi:hypothetical protein E2C01_046467 [Portunus trituberculatus]|uniref:Uncharacterized protein n=1 Tax=Portunus trituberculatus TaxID=210409 RepID=A0A5B7G587_PORTR|nr:hypothetical protein [Portunus trituberculatus]
MIRLPPPYQTSVSPSPRICLTATPPHVSLPIIFRTPVAGYQWSCKHVSRFGHQMTLLHSRLSCTSSSFTPSRAMYC